MIRSSEAVGWHVAVRIHVDPARVPDPVVESKWHRLVCGEVSGKGSTNCVSLPTTRSCIVELKE